MSQFRVCFDRHLNDLALNASPRDAHALQSPPAIAWSFPIGRRGALDLWWTIIPVDRFHRWFLLSFFIFNFPLRTFISCTNNNREWDEDKREFEFRIDLFYFSLWNSLNEMKLSLLNNYDQKNINFSRWYISIFFSFSVGNLVFVFSLPFLFFSKYFSRNEIARNRLKLRVTRIRDAIRERKSIHLVKISLLRLVFTFRNR